MGPHHFFITSFHRFVLFPKLHIVECQLVESSYYRIVKLPKLYNVEYHFLESVFSRTSVSWHIHPKVILPNVFFSNRHLAECHLPESSFSRTSFSRICIERNEHQYSIKTWLWLLLLLIRTSYGLIKNIVSIRKITSCSVKWRSAP